MCKTKYQFECKHCYEITYRGNPDDVPIRCDFCEIGFCTSCGCALKLSSSYCFKCRQVNPEIISRFNRSNVFITEHKIKKLPSR